MDSGVERVRHLKRRHQEEPRSITSQQNSSRAVTTVRAFCCDWTVTLSISESRKTCSICFAALSRPDDALEFEAGHEVALLIAGVAALTKQAVGPRRCQRQAGLENNTKLQPIQHHSEPTRPPNICMSQ